MKKLKINEEFKNLIPPLTQEEYKQLEENLIKEGCRDSLVIWNGTIVDGHNRYEICTKHNIEFSTKEMDFDNKEEVIEWIIRNQFGRRNLPTYMRAKLSLRLEDIIKLRAKENQKKSEGRGKKGNLNSENLNTDKELAKIAGVSADTIWKTRVVENEGSEEVQAQARKGEISISKAFNLTRKPEKIKEKKEVKARVCIVCGKEKPIEDFVNKDNECKQCKRYRTASGKTRDELRKLNDLFPDEELEKMYEEMKNPITETNEENEVNNNRNSIVVEFEELLNSFNRDIKKFAYMPQVKEDEISITLVNETIEILKKIIQ